MRGVNRPVRGRPRDAAIDSCVLDAALVELGAKGFEGFSLAAVADAAGTTRPAIYRRWRDKTDLVVDAVARMAEADVPPVMGEPFADLVAELANFRHCICEAGAQPLAGLMLGSGLEPAVREAYLERVVAPRRARIRALLDSAVSRGELDAAADLVVAGSFLTGSWYSFAVVGAEPPDDWAERVAALVWRACGGSVPSAAKA